LLATPRARSFSSPPEPSEQFAGHDQRVGQCPTTIGGGLPAAHGAGTITSRSDPDSAPQASPDRPSIWRTLARSWFEGKLSNFSVTGSNRTMALMLQSVSQTLSLSSTHTE